MFEKFLLKFESLQIFSLKLNFESYLKDSWTPDYSTWQSESDRKSIHLARCNQMYLRGSVMRELLIWIRISIFIRNFYLIYFPKFLILTSWEEKTWKKFYNCVIHSKMMVRCWSIQSSIRNLKAMKDMEVHSTEYHFAMK